MQRRTCEVIFQFFDTAVRIGLKQNLTGAFAPDIQMHF